jgi:hypothetical protein
MGRASWGGRERPPESLPLQAHPVASRRSMLPAGTDPIAPWRWSRLSAFSHQARGRSGDMSQSRDAAEEAARERPPMRVPTTATLPGN